MFGNSNGRDNETMQMRERRAYIQGRLIIEGPTGRKLENYLAELQAIESELCKTGISISGSGYGIFPD